MSALIDSTYRAVTAGLPAELQAPARRLLFDVGMAREPEAGWADVFRLEPSSDLPVFAVSSEHPCDERTLRAFREVHHAACFYIVLVDRVADGQAASTPEREQLAAHLLEAWRQRLAAATGNGPLADRMIDQGVRAWQCGVRLERAALARRSLGLRRYGYSILLKLGWADLASECLLRQQGQERRIPAFRLAFCLLAVGMQCVDDAADGAEDEAIHGLSLPAALGFPPAALFTAGALLTRDAASAALAGGFERFAEWLSHRASELEGLRKHRVHPTDNLAGMVIHSSLEAVCLSMVSDTRERTAGTSFSGSSTELSR